MQTAKDSIRYFYEQHGLSVAITRQNRHRIFRSSEGTLAIQSLSLKTCLTAVNQQRTICASRSQGVPQVFNFTPYGYIKPTLMPEHFPGFAGEPLERFLEGYPYGRGYRIYDPAKMRFWSADSFSPFMKNALHAFGYCGNDPVNRIDPSGHIFSSLKPKFSKSPPKMMKGIPRAKKDSNARSAGAALDAPPPDYETATTPSHTNQEPPTYGESLTTNFARERYLQQLDALAQEYAEYIRSHKHIDEWALYKIYKKRANRTNGYEQQFWDNRAKKFRRYYDKFQADTRDAFQNKTDLEAYAAKLRGAQ